VFQILLKLVILGGARVQAGVMLMAAGALTKALVPVADGVLTKALVPVADGASHPLMGGVPLGGILALHQRNLLEMDGVTHPLVRGVLSVGVTLVLDQRNPLDGGLQGKWHHPHRRNAMLKRRTNSDQLQFLYHHDPCGVLLLDGDHRTASKKQRRSHVPPK
jgi:hypothetical protein